MEPIQLIQKNARSVSDKNQDDKVATRDKNLY